MASWSSRVSRLQDGELREIAGALRRWRPPFRPTGPFSSRGSRSEGEKVYAQWCAQCHGARGEGGLAKGISNPDFLAMASDQFLLETIMKGRSNTAMPAWSRLTDGEMRNLLAFVRALQTKPVLRELTGPGRSDGVRGDPARGDSLFYYLCSRCTEGTGREISGRPSSTAIFSTLQRTGSCWNPLRATRAYANVRLDATGAGREETRPGGRQ